MQIIRLVFKMECMYIFFLTPSISVSIHVDMGLQLGQTLHMYKS
jgi:hypothetical protein